MRKPFEGQLNGIRNSPTHIAFSFFANLHESVFLEIAQTLITTAQLKPGRMCSKLLNILSATDKCNFSISSLHSTQQKENSLKGYKKPKGKSGMRRRSQGTYTMHIDWQETERNTSLWSLQLFAYFPGIQRIFRKSGKWRACVLWARGTFENGLGRQ